MMAFAGKRGPGRPNSDVQKRMRLSLKDKAAIFEEFQKGQTTHAVLGAKHGVARTTITALVKDLSALSEDERAKLTKNEAKASSAPRFPHLDQAVFRALLDARANNLPVSGPMLQDLAMEFAEALGVADQFKASTGWLLNFRERHGLKHYRLSGDSAAVDRNVTKAAQDELQELIGQFDPNGMYAAGRRNW